MAVRIILKCPICSMISNFKPRPFLDDEPVPELYAMVTTSKGRARIQNEKLPLGVVDKDAEEKYLQKLLDRLLYATEHVKERIATLVERRAKS